jgi:16S rRNA (cytidine1402-2'-O)-methyltransferase
MALVISGFDTTRFVFEGFLPRTGADRKRRLSEVARERRTIVLYEAPHRIERTLTDLGQHCGGDRRVALARELTKLHEEVWRGAIIDALAHVVETGPRGEYVVVIEGAHEPAEADDPTIHAALIAAVQGGATRKDAIATVTTDLAVPKRRVFDIAMTLPR